MISLGVVEDVAEMRGLLRLCLEEASEFRLEWMAGGVPEARLELGRKRPDWVLLDEILPGITGLDYLPELAQAGVGVILLTGADRTGASVPSQARGRLLKPSWESWRQDRSRFVGELKPLVGL